MSRPLYCRHDDCDHVDVEEAGKRPTFCPGCKRVAAWSSAPKTEATIIRPGALHPDDPKKPYQLNYEDKRFLKSLRIRWKEEEPEDDGA